MTQAFASNVEVAVREALGLPIGRDHLTPRA
jgi:hypothetical protein